MLNGQLAEVGVDLGYFSSFFFLFLRHFFSLETNFLDIHVELVDLNF